MFGLEIVILLANDIYKKKSQQYTMIVLAFGFIVLTCLSIAFIYIDHKEKKLRDNLGLAFIILMKVIWVLG
jgi:hypothetical protein